MLSYLARMCFSFMLTIGCFLRIYPYRWDKVRFRLRKASKLDMVIFNFHRSVMYFLTAFSVSRLLKNIAYRQEFPVVEKILTMSYCGAYTITSIAFLQFHFLKAEIFQFANCLLQFIENSSRKGATLKCKNREAEENLEKGILSRNMLIGIFLLAINPAVHAVIVLDSPCVPHFISSAYFPCPTIDDNSATLAEKIPFVCLEFYNSGLFLFTCSFNWSIILLGLAWIVHELRSMRIDSEATLNQFPGRYRKLQCTMRLLNNSFRFFLMFFASLLLMVVSLLMYGCIRIWHVDAKSNLMFPMCGIRCAFEAITPLQMAGTVNQKSLELLGKWKEMLEVKGIHRDRQTQRCIKILRLRNSNREDRRRKLLQLIQRSFPAINCTAGSLYTFEHSIVVVSLHNCFQLTLNLLVTFGH